VDGSEKPGLLFLGVTLLVPSVSLLAWAQSLPSKKRETEVVSTSLEMVVGVDTVVENVEKVDEKYWGEEPTATLADQAQQESSREVVMDDDGKKKREKKEESSLPGAEVNAEMEVAQWKWVVLLIGIGALNSSWGALSTVGRRNVSVHSSYFLLVLGRIGVQPVGQTMMQLILFKKSPLHLFMKVLSLPRRDKFRAYGCGLLIGLGYYTYFIGSNVVNKSAAFAISNCSPLWTIVLGVCVQKDLLQYQTKAKVAVLASAALFILSVVVLSLSGN
jgi:hypothetical protein